MKPYVSAEAIIDPESVIRALYLHHVAAEFSLAPAIELNRISDGFINLDGVLLCIVPFGVRMRCLKDFVKSKICAFLHKAEHVI